MSGARVQQTWQRLVGGSRRGGTKPRGRNEPRDATRGRRDRSRKAEEPGVDPRRDAGGEAAHTSENLELTRQIRTGSAARDPETGGSTAEADRATGARPRELEVSSHGSEVNTLCFPPGNNARPRYPRGWNGAGRPELRQRRAGGRESRRAERRPDGDIGPEPSESGRQAPDRARARSPWRQGAARGRSQRRHGERITGRTAAQQLTQGEGGR